MYTVSRVAIGAVNTGLDAGGRRGPAPLHPLARPSSGEQVATWIRARILAGDLVRGDRVVQEEVARELGVSRIPVREALVALDLEGWVALRPHRGAFVRGVDAGWVRDHYELLGVFYGRAAQWAAARSDRAERARLGELHEGFVVAAGIDAFDAANHAILQHLLAMARSPRLVAALRATGSIVPGNFFAAVPDTVDAQRDGIGVTVAEVQRGAALGARDALERLVTRQGEAVVALLETRRVLGAEAL